jgi:hypothetical protein
VVNDYTGVDDTAQMDVRAWLYVDMQGARNLSFVAPTPETYAVHHEIIELVPARAPVDDVRLASSAAAYAPFEVLQGRFTVDGQIALGYSIGVRTENADAIVFAPSLDAAFAAARAMGSSATLFGTTRKTRCALLGEEQVRTVF